jgi:hypothetical protein
MCNPKKTINQLIDSALKTNSFSLLEEEKTFSNEALESAVYNYQSVLEQHKFKSILLVSPKCKDSLCLIFSIIKRRGSFICSYRSGQLTLWLKQLDVLPVDVLAIHESLIDKNDEPIINPGVIKTLSFYWIKQNKPQIQCLTPGIGFYSSGTTNNPKAVIHPYKSIFDYLLWGKKTFKLTQEDRFLFTTELSFIASLRPLLFPIVGKHTVVIAPHSLLIDAAKFLAFIKERRITIISITPSFLKHLSLEFERQGSFSSSLRLILLSGEPCDPDIIKTTYRFFKYRIKIYDIYGATEILAPFYKEIPFEPTGQELKCLGKLRNVYSFRFVPYNENYYQLFIYGAITANYINAIEKNQNYGFKKGTRYYLGDDLFILQKNVFILSTRKQYLIKHFGLLINLRAIQEEILKLPNISDCAVIFNDKLKQLEAFVVSKNKHQIKESINQHLNQELPSYMHPKLIKILDEMPINKHGKVDIKKLSKNSITLKKMDLIDYVKHLSGNENVTLKTCLFSLNLRSIDYIELSQFLLKENQQRIEFSMINDTTTIGDLCTILQPATKIYKPSTKNFLPLSEVQQYMASLYYSLNKSKRGSYSHTFKLKKNLCLIKLERAILSTISSHFMLSCQLQSRNGSYIFKHVNPPKKALHNYVLTMIKRLKCKTVPLSSKRLFNAYIFKTNNNHFLRLNFHHLIQDGWAMWRVLSEIFYRYEDENYRPALTFEDEASLILAFIQAEEQSNRSVTALSIPKGYKYFVQNKYQPSFSENEHHSLAQSYFRIPRSTLHKFQKKHHLEKFSMKTIILLVYSLAISNLYEVSVLPILITLSKRGMPLENLVDMISPCATALKLVIPFDSLSLEQTAAIIEHDLQLLFSFACSNQALQLMQTSNHQAITRPSVAYTYVDINNSDSSILNKHIDWKQSSFSYESFTNDMLFIRAYDMNLHIHFFINNRFSKDINLLIKKQIGKLLKL